MWNKGPHCVHMVFADKHTECTTCRCREPYTRCNAWSPQCKTGYQQLCCACFSSIHTSAKFFIWQLADRILVLIYCGGNAVSCESTATWADLREGSTFWWSSRKGGVPFSGLCSFWRYTGRQLGADSNGQYFHWCRMKKFQTCEHNWTRNVKGES